ncbi:ATP-binding protein [Cellulomonas fimi]|uniref:sensor histidine kinase n=1 Tax=Cellulomonas fimi TaxID=1708 RepID=UPI00234CF2DE|nr:ATP-binding protein [Cellulomonas fimi]MDC7123033.1 ATP-binding protein [Cellulomonas fimi]
MTSSFRTRVPAVPAGGGSRLLTKIASRLGDDANVVERQLPFLGVYLVAVLTLWIPTIPVTAPWAVWVSAGIAVLLAVVARLVHWRDEPEWTQDLLPILQIVCVGFLRFGTGGIGSMFTVMIFLPVLALAAQRGWRGPIISVIGVNLVILLPAALDPDMPLDTLVLARGLFVSLVALVVAVTAHEVTERLRARTEAVAVMRDREQEMVERMRADAFELARVADARRAARDELVSIIDSATEQAIIATDAAGTIRVFNAGAERLLGYGQGEVVGKKRITDLYAEMVEMPASPPRAPGSVAARLLESIVTPEGGSGARDASYRRRDGTEVTVRLAVTRRLDVDGSVAGYVVVATDVTAEREASRLKDEFVSLVSHELRTPLTSVLGYLELLLDGTDELTEEQRSYLTVIERNARRQLRLVGDLLLTAQVDAGTFAISPRGIDLADVVTGSVASLGPVAEQAGIRLTTSIEPAPVTADPGRLSQVVDNLVSNAVKFTPAGGEVHLSVGPTPDGGAALSVRDTGIGIAPDELSRLTTRFFRATSATRRAIPGVGLGLAIARAVVDAHGGLLDIESTLGEGTTFVVTLPAAPPPDARA